MYRVFVDEKNIRDGFVTVEGADAHHLADVLRVKAGENIYVCTGDEWEYTCRVTQVSNAAVRAKITDAAKSAKELPAKITLYQCVPKKDRMEQAVQKSVELGVYAVVPVMSSRCVVKLDEKKASERVKRLNAIADEAAKQSKRMIEPRVSMPLEFKEAVKQAAEADLCIMPYEKASGMDETRRVLSEAAPGRDISILIGPEGGFEDEEARFAIDHGFKTVTLGKRILRTETAGPALLAILGFLLEE